MHTGQREHHLRTSPCRRRSEVSGKVRDTERMRDGGKAVVGQPQGGPSRVDERNTGQGRQRNPQPGHFRVQESSSRRQVVQHDDGVSAQVEHRSEDVREPRRTLEVHAGDPVRATPSGGAAFLRVDQGRELSEEGPVTPVPHDTDLDDPPATQTGGLHVDRGELEILGRNPAARDQRHYFNQVGHRARASSPAIPENIAHVR